MLDSRALDSYGVFLIPLFLVLGYAMIQTHVMKKKLSYVGLVLFILGWLMFYDRAEAWDDKEDHLVWSTLLVLLASAGLLYSELKNKYVLVASALFASSWAYLVWCLSENDVSEEKTQYIILSTLLIIISVVYFIPKQRRENNLFDIGLPMFAIGWTMLANSVADSPAKDLIIY